MYVVNDSHKALTQLVCYALQHILSSWQYYNLQTTSPQLADVVYRYALTRGVGLKPGECLDPNTSTMYSALLPNCKGMMMPATWKYHSQPVKSAANMH